MFVSTRPRREATLNASYREPTEADIFASRGSLYDAEEDRTTTAAASRRSVRPKGKESPLDALAGNSLPVPGAPTDLSYALGGAETGGLEAERILREVEIDDNAIELRMQFSSGRRVVLSYRRRAVAAAVVEFHASESLVEIPILAAARALRGQGHGSLLVALLVELACKLGARMLVVSATDESRRFWLRQGLHTVGHCEPPVAAALRALAQKGARYGFFETTQMARALPKRAPPAGSLVEAALARARHRAPASQGLSAAKVADILGYDDLPPDDTAATRDVDVPPGKLQAFAKEGPADAALPTAAAATGWGIEGWGVRSTVHISKGETVVEFCGRSLSEAEHAALYGGSAAEARRFVLALSEFIKCRRGDVYHPECAAAACTTCVTTCVSCAGPAPTLHRSH